MPAGAMDAVPACILVRHAHAEWPAYRGPDFDRPLTGRGLADALAAGQAMRAAGLRPRRLLSSAARRTEQTARVLLEQLGLPEDSLELRESLYNADAATLRAALREAAGESPVLLVAHNPGISELARLLSGQPAESPFRPAEWRTFGAVQAPATSAARGEKPR